MWAWGGGCWNTIGRPTRAKVGAELLAIRLFGRRRDRDLLILPAVEVPIPAHLDDIAKVADQFGRFTVFVPTGHSDPKPEFPPLVMNAEHAVPVAAWVTACAVLAFLLTLAGLMGSGAIGWPTAALFGLALVAATVWTIHGRPGRKAVRG